MNKGLHRHVQFFDRNHDGIITAEEIYQGLRQLRFSFLTAWLGSVSLPRILSKKTGGTHGKIIIAGIDKARHSPDDSGGFRTPPLSFPNQATFSIREIQDLIRQRGGKPRVVQQAIEWDLLFGLMRKFRPRIYNQRKEEVLTREEIQHLFDGSLFFRLTNTPIPHNVE